MRRDSDILNVLSQSNRTGEWGSRKFQLTLKLPSGNLNERNFAPGSVTQATKMSTF